MRMKKRSPVRSSGAARTGRPRARFHFLTIFPGIFDSYLGESLFRRARGKKIIETRVYNIRDFSRDRHLKVDDRPFGGGPGMVMKVEPVSRAVSAIKRRRPGARTILFGPRGKAFDADAARRLAHYSDLILICGRYEGVDERVARRVADEEISIGPYVLSGGELPALVLAEAVSRHVPGFLGKEESLEEINGSFPAYTRPEVFFPPPAAAAGGGKNGRRRKPQAWRVPKVLLSGNHEKIAEWRRNAGQKRPRRPRV